LANDNYTKNYDAVIEAANKYVEGFRIIAEAFQRDAAMYGFIKRQT
jgi:hypothetical protein